MIGNVMLLVEVHQGRGSRQLQLGLHGSQQGHLIRRLRNALCILGIHACLRCLCARIDVIADVVHGKILAESDAIWIVLMDPNPVRRIRKMRERNLIFALACTR